MKDKILVSTRKGLIVFKKNLSGHWVYDGVHFLGLPVSMVYYEAYSQTLWACLDHGHWGCKLHKSKDEGKSWQEVEAPKYPEGAEVREGVPAGLKYIWSMTSIHHEDQNRILLGTEPGGLFESNDEGLSFHLIRPLWDHPTRKELWFGGGRDHPGIHSIVVDPANNDHFYVGISCAGVFETVDGGHSWTPRNKGLIASFLPDVNAEVGQDPHLLVQCTSNPKVMWQQNHCGIFRTEDGGAQWKDISDHEGQAFFGFAIAADDLNDQLAWVAPAVSDEIRVAVDNSLCICRTDDGGRSWKTFTNGLPQHGTFDITYRHALDQKKESVVFGTTTGNLYTSNDYGENWITLSNNLPMVHCVDLL